MSERMTRAAFAVFFLLAAATGVNLVVLQPLSIVHGGAKTGTGSGAWGAMTETAALSVTEIDAGAASPSGGGVGQRVVVVPPVPDFRQLTRDVQSALEARGYETGGNDGVLGPVTQAAILAYETDHGLALTAEPSENLLKAILSGDSAAVPGPGQGTIVPGPRAEQLIRNVQQALAKLGYGTGKADGRLGEATIGTIRQFEKQQGMPDTGRISGELLVRLTRLAGPGRTADKR